MSLDKFYPLSQTITACPGGIWQIGMVAKLEGHLQSAKNGNRDSESRLVNRLGQLRRHFNTLDEMSGNLQDVYKKAITWLRANERVCDLTNPNPALWISQRGGAPRW